MKRFVPIVALLVGPACGGENGGGGPADGGDVWEPPPRGEYGEACPPDARIGRFEVAQYQLYSAITGTVREEVVPVSVLEPVGGEGDCTFMQQVNPYCEPRCVSGETCDTDGTCIPFPTRKSVGTVRVAGLAERITIEPDVVNNYSETAVPDPIFEPGDEVQLWADGDEVEGFALDGAGVAPIEVANVDWPLNAGEPLDIDWTPSDGPGRILVSLNVDWHGASPVTLFCDMEDTGHLTVSAELVDDLFGYGFTLPTTGIIKRRTVDSADAQGGCVELEVLSQLEANLLADAPE